jgi:FMN phosphatase YigB (HAD superfamily)
MTTAGNVAFLFDVDNTLLDNDRVEKDLRHHLEQKSGSENRDRYFAILEELRAELGYADYLGALQRYRLLDLCDPRLLEMSSYLVDYPFANRLYPGSLDALDHARKWGLPVILSDGDVVFQPRKIHRSGIWEAVEGRVLVYIHKEEMLPDVERNYPAGHYIMVDDKLRILTAMKKVWGDRLTTVWPHQGHYALDPQALTMYPPADITLERIGDLVDHDLSGLLTASKSAQTVGGTPHQRLPRRNNESNQTPPRPRTKPLA